MDALATRKAVEIPVNDVIYREDLYPRSLTVPSKVQDYHANLDCMPPIEVNQQNILIDGWHRWTAHKKAERATIKAILTETKSDIHLKELAVERNADHGIQLSQEDKRAYARERYHLATERQRPELRKRLANILSVSDRTVRDWVSRIDKDAKEARDRRVFEMWLACHTQQEIAESADCSKAAVNDLCSEMANLPKLNKMHQAAAAHASDFDPPIYNVWKQQEKTAGSTHFGNSEVRWLDNLLYLYTEPFDVVVDPFAGGGSTIDLCKKRFRRYFVSDRKPIVEREKEIRRHDLTEGLPKVPRWKDVRLVYLDPPYWKQAEGQYSNDPTDLANMPLDEFHENLASIVTGFAKKLSDAYVALIIQPTQWKAPERTFTDHVAEMIRRVKLPIDMRFSVPYESQQCTAQMVEWAKEHRRCLVLSREIIVWRV